MRETQRDRGVASGRMTAPSPDEHAGLEALTLFHDDELPSGEPGAVREFFARWVAELRASSASEAE